MRIYIPSLSRPNTQRTWAEISFTKWKDRVQIIVPESQYAAYKGHDQYSPILAHPDELNNIGKVREWICSHLSIANGDPHVLMLDDDMGFIKRLPGDWRMKGCTSEQLEDLFQEIEYWIQVMPMVGISMRQGNNHTFPKKRTFVGRMMNAYCLDVEILERENVRWNRLPVMEDFDVTLQMLRKGYPNVIIQEYAVGQITSNMEGGCSTYRTGEVQATAANMLSELHSPFVTVVEKESKSSWEGMKKRTDVRIQWKQAFLSSGAELPSYSEHDACM
jgi:hypothetical protein